MHISKAITGAGGLVVLKVLMSCRTHGRRDGIEQGQAGQHYNVLPAPTGGTGPTLDKSHMHSIELSIQVQLPGYLRVGLLVTALCYCLKVRWL